VYLPMRFREFIFEDRFSCSFYGAAGRVGSTELINSCDGMGSTRQREARVFELAATLSRGSDAQKQSK